MCKRFLFWYKLTGQYEDSPIVTRNEFHLRIVFKQKYENYVQP